MFDEQRLRQDIAATWGEHGAHIDVFDFMLREIEQLREVLVFADGFVVSQSDHTMVLADLYNDTTPLAGAIQRAGCHPRRRFRDG